MVRRFSKRPATLNERIHGRQHYAPELPTHHPITLAVSKSDSEEEQSNKSDNESKQNNMSDNESKQSSESDNASSNGDDKATRNEVNMNADSIVDDRNEGDGNNERSRDADEAVVGGGGVDGAVVQEDGVPNNERGGSFLHHVLFDYTKIYLRQ